MIFWRIARSAVEGGSLLAGDESLESKGLAGLHDGLDPLGGSRLGESALGVEGLGLGDDLSILVARPAV